MIQGHVPARVWGFESPLRHQYLDDTPANVAENLRQLLKTPLTHHEPRREVMAGVVEVEIVEVSGLRSVLEGRPNAARRAIRAGLQRRTLRRNSAKLRPRGGHTMA
jgi:hypothetical protein